LATIHRKENTLLVLKSDPLRKFLESYSGEKVHFFPKPGNAGDGYITWCSFLLFDQYGIDIASHKIDEIVKDSTVFIGGGGNLIEDRYGEVRDLIDKLCPLNNRVVLLPQTISGNREIFRLTHENLSVFCRDRVSYDHAIENGANPKTTFLSHDLTLFMGTRPLEGIQKSRSEKDRIEIFRTDGESASLHDLSPANFDASMAWNGDIWQAQSFCKQVTLSMAEYINPYNQVVTDRLHVSILAAQMGKEVTLLPNSYFKNEAVFAHSLSQMFPKMSFGLPEHAKPLVEQSSSAPVKNPRVGNLSQQNRGLFDNWQIDSNFFESALAIARSLGSVSLDIFDTALTRTVETPVDIFGIVEGRLSESRGDSGVGFARAREEAEKRARDRHFLDSGAEEVTLDQIYDELRRIWKRSEEVVLASREFELKAELESLVAVPDILRLTQVLKAEGIPYFFVSDMYLPREFILSCLLGQGFSGLSGIYLSSELGATKSTGNIWVEVAKDRSLSSFLHIGDNEISDLEKPKEYNIRTLAFNRVISNRRTGVRVDKHSPPSSASRRFHQLASRGISGNSPKETQFWEVLGKSLGTPIVGSFLIWLIERARVNDIDTLYFCSRDGYVLLKAWNTLGLSATYGVDVKYLPVSRKVLLLSAGYLASTTNKLDKQLIHFLSKIEPGLTIRSALQRAGLDQCQGLIKSLKINFVSLDAPLLQVDVEAFEACLRKSSSEIYSALSMVYEPTRAFLRQEGLFTSKRNAIVDLGWHGNLQKSLQRLIAEESQESFLAGFYYGLWPAASGNRYLTGLMESCFGSDFLSHDEQPALSASVAVMEELHSAPHGSVDGYFSEESGQFSPIYRWSPHEENQYFRFVKPFQDALIEELIDTFTTSGGALPEYLTPNVALKAIGAVLLCPTPEESENLGKLGHSESFGHNSWSLIVDPVVPLELADLHRSLSESQWQVGQASNWLKSIKSDHSDDRFLYLDSFLNSHPGRKPWPSIE
jgi:predicted HAD superfamily hydrolase/exopolysaccharide biosynthesis predicted pyruvyltransferase EpsI